MYTKWYYLERYEIPKNNFALSCRRQETSVRAGVKVRLEKQGAKRNSTNSKGINLARHQIRKKTLPCHVSPGYRERHLNELVEEYRSEKRLSCPSF